MSKKKKLLITDPFLDLVFTHMMSEDGTLNIIEISFLDAEGVVRTVQGSSRCHEDDKPNDYTGYNLAMGRALRKMATIYNKAASREVKKASAEAKSLKDKRKKRRKNSDRIKAQLKNS